MATRTEDEMSEPPILVNNQPFFGRVEEQKQFIAALNELRNPPRDETLPYVFLLYGDGGIGKSTLALRFRDIALEERPSKGRSQVLWLDWEKEEKERPSLSVGREHIGAEALFDTIHQVAVFNFQVWGGYLERYNDAIRKRHEAEREVANALASIEDADQYAGLRGAGAAAIAKLIRMQVPIGETGENLAKQFLDMGIKVAAEKAAGLRAMVENRIRARLEPEQFEMFLSPHEQLALALADGLKQIAEEKPLLVFLDTYEIVDRADRWLRMVIRAAGPRLLWVIAGRNDLTKDREFGGEYFKGYANDFPRRLITYDVRRLAQEDVEKYFAVKVPERPLDSESLEAISRATRGIPLAVRVAADIWAKGQPLSEIVKDITHATPRRQIVKRMTDRYFVHCLENDTDRRALYALALARGDDDILRALLNPNNDPEFELDKRLGRLERAYASVYREKARLHDEPGTFLLEDLKTKRNENWVRAMNERALAAVQQRRARLEARHPSIEERHEDEDWVQAVLDEAYYLFWLDEGQAWHWLVPRYVEGLAYSRDVRRGLVNVLNEWKESLSAEGRKRLKMLQEQEGPFSFYDASLNSDFLEELTRLEQRGWLAGEGEGERRAILAWQRGKLLYRGKEFAQALRLYEQAELGLPNEGESLKKKLAVALAELGDACSGGRKAVASPLAFEAYEHSLLLNSDQPYVLHEFAIQQQLVGQYKNALENYLKRHRMAVPSAVSWNNLGTLYRDLGRYEEAVAAFQRAIELDPKYASPYLTLGVIYMALNRLDEAIATLERGIELGPENASERSSLAGAYLRLGRKAEYREQVTIARELIGKEDEYNRACYEAICGNADEALQLLKVALQKRQTSMEWVQRDPDLDFIRDDPRFKELVGEE
jgi:tetratricopeptide (TPR) repeat protein